MRQMPRLARQLARKRRGWRVIRGRGPRLAACPQGRPLWSMASALMGTVIAEGLQDPLTRAGASPTPGQTPPIQEETMSNETRIPEGQPSIRYTPASSWRLALQLSALCGLLGACGPQGELPEAPLASSSQEI